MYRIIKTIIYTFLCIPLFMNAQGGKTEQGKMKSFILGAEKEYTVYLPAGYEDSTTDYPVLYLLHGAWGNHKNWVNNGNIAYLADRTIKAGNALPMIIVMPDASGTKPNGAGKHMGYFNYDDWKYQDFFMQELIPYIEKKYKAKKDKQNRAIAGLSMGGGGSVILAQKYPDYFGSACSLSGALIGSNETPSEDVDAQFLKYMNEDDQTVFVNQATSATLEKLKTVRWYVDCGDDDFLIKGNVQFFLAMKEKNIPIEYRMRDGEHRWEYWQEGIVPVLEFISVGFK